MLIGLAISIGIVAAVAACVATAGCVRRCVVAVRRWATWREIRRAHRRQKIELQRTRRSGGVMRS